MSYNCLGHCVTQAKPCCTLKSGYLRRVPTTWEARALQKSIPMPTGVAGTWLLNTGHKCEHWTSIGSLHPFAICLQIWTFMCTRVQRFDLFKKVKNPGPIEMDAKFYFVDNWNCPMKDGCVHSLYWGYLQTVTFLKAALNVTILHI